MGNCNSFKANSTSSSTNSKSSSQIYQLSKENQVLKSQTSSQENTLRDNFNELLEINCPNCKYHYDDNNHTPMIYSCGHSLCNNCYNKCNSVCQVCQKVSSYEPFINYQLLELVVIIQEKRLSIKESCQHNKLFWDWKLKENTKCSQCEISVIAKPNPSLLDIKAKHVYKADNKCKQGMYSCSICLNFYLCLNCLIISDTCPCDKKLAWIQSPTPCIYCYKNIPGFGCDICKTKLCSHCYITNVRKNKNNKSSFINPLSKISSNNISKVLTTKSIADIGLCHIATGSSDGSLKFWNLNSGECLRTLRENNAEQITCLAKVSPNTIAVGGKDSKIKIWRIGTGQCVKILTGHSGNIISLTMMNNNTKLVSASQDKSIKIWDIENLSSAKCLKTINTSAVDSVLKISNKEFITSCRKTINLWNTDSEDSVKTVEEGNIYVYCMIKLEDNLIASASSSNKIIIWILENGDRTNTLEGHSSYVECLVKLNDTTICSGSYDKSIKIWNYKTGECLKTIENAHSEKITSLIRINDNTIISSSSDKKIKEWNIESGECTKTMSGHSGSVDCMINFSMG